jgi:hypothetical protein
MRASVSGGIKAPSARDGFEAGQPWAVFHIVSRRSRNSLAGQNLLQGVPNGARSTSRGRRRVVAKAEWTQGEANPRFVVTSLKRSEAGARQLYEDIHCARGDKIAASAFGATVLVASCRSTNTRRKSIGPVRNAG